MFKLTRSEQIAIAVLVFLLIIVNLGIYVIDQRRQGRAVELESNMRAAEPAQYNDLDSKRQLLVHISGEVELPGIYRFGVGSRVYQALNRAKVKPSGYVEHLNMAAYLIDGQKIDVPKKRSISGGGTTSVSSLATDSKKININTATAAELETLNGIGQEYARRIIEYRNNKHFATIEEIVRVKGIGLKLFQKIKDKICVE